MSPELRVADTGEKVTLVELNGIVAVAIEDPFFKIRKVSAVAEPHPRVKVTLH